ncbi:MAG: DUF4214 domain-containing protein [Bryobacteraceae bacterium]
MTKFTQRWTGRLSILVAAAFLLTGTIAGLNKWKLAANATSASAKTLNPQQQEPIAEAKVKSTVSKLPLAFEANLGQTDARVKYVARASGYTVFLTEKDAVLSMQGAPGTTATIRMEFEGSQGAAKITPDQKLSAKATYMVGDSSTWRKDVPMYATVRYQSIYPGIEVAYKGDSRQFRYDFIVKPGADPNAIRLNFAGADKVSVTKSGDLALEIAGKTLVHKKPYLYQEAGGEKKEIAGNYTVSGNKVGFTVGNYDHANTLVIDPTVVVSSYVGGSQVDDVNAVTVNTSNIASAVGVYAAGGTNSITFTGATGVTTGAPIGLNDVFVVKTNLAVTTPLYLIYLGGTNNDAANSIAVDEVGRASLAGTTFSSNFGALTNTTGGGTNDGWYMRLNVAGTAAEAGVYIGGSTNDFGTGIALDNNGVAPYNTFIGGYTDSLNFPVTAGVANNGSSDAFIVRIPHNGVAINAARTYGGSGAEIALGLAVLQPNALLNPAGTNVGDAYIVGTTTGGNWASNDNTVLSVGVGAGANPRDPFVVRASASGLAANWISFLYGYNDGPGGGADFPSPATLDDSLTGVAVDPTGRAIVGGQTRSLGLSTPGAYQTALSGGAPNYDCWLARVQPFAAPNNYVTYYGAANSNEDCLAVGTDTSGQIYAAGTTTLIAAAPNALQMSNGTNGSLPNVPVPGPLGLGGFTQTPNPAAGIGEADAFKVRFNPNAVGAVPVIAQLNVAEFFYGSAAGTEALTTMAVTQDRTIYVGGYSNTSGINTANPTWQTTLKGSQDGVLAAESINDVLVTPDGLNNILNPNSGLSFGPYTDGDPVPAAKTFVVAFTGATLPFVLPADASPANVTYVTVPPATAFIGSITPDITPGVVRITLAAASVLNTLQEGTHTATFNVTAPGSDNGAAQIRVRFVKSPNWVEPVTSMTFSYDIATNVYSSLSNINPVAIASDTQADIITTNDFSPGSTLHVTATYTNATNPVNVTWLQASKSSAPTTGQRTLTGTNSDFSIPPGDGVLSTINFKVCPANNCPGGGGVFPDNNVGNNNALQPGVYTATVTKIIDRVLGASTSKTFTVTLNVTNSAQTIQLTPNQTPTLYAGQTQTIFATVANGVPNGIFSALDTVGWSLAPLGGSCTGGAVAANGDTISNAGPTSTTLFTARPAIAVATSATVTACRTAPGQTVNPSVSTLTINLLPPSGVTMTPAGPLTLYAGQTQQFTTNVTNAPGVTATYAIISGGTGSIGPTGLYVAPNTIVAATTDLVQATIVAPDGTKTSNIVTVNLSPASTLTLTATPTPPATGNSLYANQTSTLTATATNAGAATPTLTLLGPGTLVGNVYTAPATITLQTTATVTATLNGPDGTRTAVVTFTLVPSSNVAVSANPTVIYSGQTSTFTATTINPAGLVPTWTVQSGGGSINAGGVYTAPTVSASTVVTVQATVTASDGQRTGTQTITVLPASAISLNPQSVTRYPSEGAVQFTATTANANGVQPTFTVSPAVGSIDATGRYTPPASVGAITNVTITATLAAADSTRTDTAHIFLQPDITISPLTAIKYAGQTQQFTVAQTIPFGYTLSYSTSGSGQINAAGLYTAPSPILVDGSETITARVTNNSTGATVSTATAVVTLRPASTLSLSATPASVKSNQTSTITATTTNPAGATAITYTLNGPGSLSTLSGVTTVYTPPAGIAQAGTATVTGSWTAPDGVRTASVTINLLTPTSLSVVASGTTSLYASQTVGLTANGVPTDTITWTTSACGNCQLSTSTTTNGQGLVFTAASPIIPGQTPTSVTVTATATNPTDGARTATIVITQVPPVSVTLSANPSGVIYPSPGGLNTPSQTTITALVLNSTSQNVNWTLSGPGSLTPPVSGTQTVTYVAPAFPGVNAPTTATVTATVVAPDPTGPKTASIIINLTPAVTVSVSPNPGATTFAGGTQQFTATVGNTSPVNTNVTWTVTGGGTINASGLYSAPPSGTVPVQVTVTVTATSVFDSTKSASSTFQLVPSVGAIFSNEKFIKRNYIDFLGRLPDSSGNAFWLAQLAGGRTTAQVGRDFFNSPEFKQTGLVIANAYVGLLGRDPDFQGFTFWLNSIRNGQAQTALINTFVTSPEFIGTYGNTSDMQYIQLLYLNTLQRAATQADLNFWVPQVATAGRATIAGYFILSDEFNIRFRARQLANLLYLGFLGRTPDPLGRQFWTNELGVQGVNELIVIGNFINSQEYLIRLNATPLP